MNALLAPLLLAASLAALAWFHRNAVRRFQRFGDMPESRRPRAFLRWAARGLLRNLGIALLGLALLGRLDAVWRFPDEFAPLAAGLPYFGLDDPLILATVLTALPAGLALSAAIAPHRPRRPVRGYDIQPMLPRDRRELLSVLPLVLAAGIGEEVYFRLYLPLLLMLCGAPDWVAFLLASLIFGLIHRYQGWIGTLLTGLAGAVLALLYLGSWGLALPIAFHLAINFNTLFLRPAVLMRFRPRTD